jgi:predicted ATPase
MSRIRIKDFGPIKEGYLDNDGWIEVNKVTVFIGNQGSGKSTVAKLISTLTWIEKAMIKREIKQDELSVYNRFVKRLEYQRINNYIKPQTVIEYQGDAFTFIFLNGVFYTSPISEERYVLPKIMYVPAERNFLSVVDRPDRLKELPSPLFTFLDEYDRARNLYYEGLTLPINGVQFVYDRQNKIAHIAEADYQLRLSEASSGFQSTVPLFLVTKYLSEFLFRENGNAINEQSIEEERRLEKEMQEIQAILDDPEVSPDVKQAYLRRISAKRRPSCFINIVEEPEQNLFPSSQWQMLQSLLEFNNINDGNKLIITTHSPYIINFLSIAIQADYLKNKIIEAGKQEELLPKIWNVISDKSLISSDSVIVYQLNETDGHIKRLSAPEGIPTDKNYLNDMLREGNNLFDILLEIEEEI